jgi:cytochrome c oxidase cbb3-type subunit 1
MVSIGCLYYLIPRLFGRTEMYSVKLITVHFWVSTIGVVLYIAAMWIAGVMQGLMWRDFNVDGTLKYSFAEVVKAMYPYYMIRLLGGALFFAGMLIMAYNVIKTIAGQKAVDAAIPAPAHA